MNDPAASAIEKEQENKAEHLICIPLTSLPLVGEADSGLAIRPVLHRDRTTNFNVLIYLTKGEMEIIEDGAAYTLTPGTLFFLKSGVHHWGEKPYQVGTAWYYVHFYCGKPSPGMQPLEKQAPLGNRVSLSPEDHSRYVTIPKILSLPLENELEKQIVRLVRLFHSADIARANLLLMDILLHSMELHHGRMGKTKEDRRKESMITFLERNACRSFTAAELEQEIGLTYKHLGSLFKRKTGMTIKEYQMMLRMQRAVKLLSESEMTLSQIANELGFYDSFYFSRMFKRLRGVSPQKFRDTYMPGI